MSLMKNKLKWGLFKRDNLCMQNVKNVSNLSLKQKTMRIVYFWELISNTLPYNNIFSCLS